MSFGKLMKTIHSPSGEMCGNQLLYSSFVTCVLILAVGLHPPELHLPLRLELK